MQSFLDTAISAAREAGEIVIGIYDEEKDIRFKNDIQTDVVTKADLLSEERIVSILRKEYPHHGFLTEEKLSSNKDAEYVWIIDPIDGTFNYANHIPIFMIAIGLQHKGELVLAVAYDPMHDELFHAERGKGAFVNGTPLHVSTRAVRQSSVGLLWSRRFNSPPFITTLFDSSMKVSNYGSSIATLCYIAAGRLDGAIGKGLKPWDLTASLIVEEAGGRMTLLSGEEFRLDGDEMVASNGIIHDRLLEIVRG